MKRISLLLALLALAGCKEPTKKQSELLSGGVYVTGIYEFVDVDGVCLAGQFFGDSANGCVKTAQVLKFADGAAFFSLELGSGPTNEWTWVKFIPPGSTAFDETFNLGSNVRFRAVGDLTADPPTLELMYDHTLDFTDAPTYMVPLVEVVP